MSQMRLASLRVPPSVRSRFAEAGLVAAGIVSVVSSLLAAATIYLVVLQPTAVVQALVERQPEVPLEALVSVVMAAVTNLVSGS